MNKPAPSLGVSFLLFPFRETRKKETVVMLVSLFLHTHDFFQKSQPKWRPTEILQLWVCVRVCVCACLWVPAYECLRMCRCVWVRVRVRACVWACVWGPVYVHVCVSACMCVCELVYEGLRMCTCVCACACVCIPRVCVNFHSLTCPCVVDPRALAYGPVDHHAKCVYFCTDLPHKCLVFNTII